MKYKTVNVRAPLRISLAGGGCDFPDFFNNYDSTPVTSIAINLYVYVNVRRLSNFYDEKFRLEYYNVEHCNKIDEIKNNLIRGVLNYLKWDEPVYISLSSDIPGYSGLGTSSSFCVALIGALRYLRGDGNLSVFELVKNAIEVELDVLGLKMGIQDALPAAFGGFHTYFMHKGRKITVQKHDEKILNSLLNEKLIFLVWTGNQRESNSVLHKQIKLLEEKNEYYIKMRNLSIKFVTDLSQVINDSSKLLKLIIETIQIASNLKNFMTDNLYSDKSKFVSNMLKNFGIDAQRVVGAGNGGFILCSSTSSNLNYAEIENNIGKLINPCISYEGFEIIFYE